MKNALVYSPDGQFRRKDIGIEGEVFGKAAGGPTLNADGLLAIPGLVDIHLHGCAGADFSDGDPAGMCKMAQYQGENGVTTLVPATMTLPEETLVDICRTAASLEEAPGAGIMGINLEGPFISKRKLGSQNPEYVKAPDAAMMERLLAASGGFIKLVTIAPETPGAGDFVRAFGERVRISLGHTECGYDLAMEMFSLGVRHVTHLYNAMPPMLHRAPGLVGAVFDDSRCRAELICDGIHVHPAVIRTTFKQLGSGRVVLVSDSMRATGMPDGAYTLGGLPVTVDGARAVLTGTEVLAGSATNLMDCLRYAVGRAGIPLREAVQCATENPARAAGIFDRCGSIEHGKKADLVLLDESLAIRQVIVRGKVLN